MVKKKANKRKRTKSSKLIIGWNPKQKAYVFYAENKEDAAYMVRAFGYKGHDKKIKSIRRDRRYKPHIAGGRKYYRYRIDLTGW